MYIKLGPKIAMAHRSDKRSFSIVEVAAALLWLDRILAVSFLAVPAIFPAPSLSLTRRGRARSSLARLSE
jgi:hypothetical protein